MLKEEVKFCPEFLWSKYGKTDEQPPFDPKSVNCKQLGATTIFESLLNAMSCDGHSSNTQEANENKVVAVLYILMFGQSQKVNWFQKCLSTHAVSKGISGSGLSLLNQCGVSTSRKT